MYDPLNDVIEELRQQIDKLEGELASPLQSNPFSGMSTCLDCVFGGVRYSVIREPRGPRTDFRYKYGVLFSYVEGMDMVKAESFIALPEIDAVIFYDPLQS